MVGARAPCETLRGVDHIANGGAAAPASPLIDPTPHGQHHRRRFDAHAFEGSQERLVHLAVRRVRWRPAATLGWWPVVGLAHTRSPTRDRAGGLLRPFHGGGPSIAVGHQVDHRPGTSDPPRRHPRTEQMRPRVAEPVQVVGARPRGRIGGRASERCPSHLARPSARARARAGLRSGGRHGGGGSGRGLHRSTGTGARSRARLAVEQQ